MFHGVKTGAEEAEGLIGRAPGLRVTLFADFAGAYGLHLRDQLGHLLHMERIHRHLSPMKNNQFL